jgi:hypothetical protein
VSYDAAAARGDEVQSFVGAYSRPAPAAHPDAVYAAASGSDRIRIAENVVGGVGPCKASRSANRIDDMLAVAASEESRRPELIYRNE